jgi:hypothetical protein
MHSGELSYVRKKKDQENGADAAATNGFDSDDKLRSSGWTYWRGKVS